MAVALEVAEGVLLLGRPRQSFKVRPVVLRGPERHDVERLAAGHGEGQDVAVGAHLFRGVSFVCL